MRKSTSSRIREVKARHQLLVTDHQAPKVQTGDRNPSQISVPIGGDTSVLSSIIRNPICAHDRILELERRVLKLVNNRIQGHSDTSSDNSPEGYCCENLGGLDHSVMLTALDALVQNLFGGSTRSGVAVSTTISNRMQEETLHGVNSKRHPAACPKDLRTLYQLFDLDPRVTTYACCPVPTCSALYPPNSTAVPNSSIYPLRCTQRRFGTTCKEHLTDGFQSIGGLSVPKPIKPFQYHHFHDHVAAMLARPGIEEAIETHMQKGSLGDELADIMSSPTLRKFLDHTGQPFVRAAGTELRLVWALSADWYNPHFNKAAGKTVSTGAIAMVCLSLPPNLRNLEENVYLAGLIPGPKEPAVDATNHFVTPLINDLVVSYKRGVHYSRTYCYPTGRTSRSAVVPVIADTMASKKVTGNCGHGAKFFCSRCRLTRDQIDNLDVKSWPVGLTRKEHEYLANEWRQATSKSAQNSHLKMRGIRWSPLLLLPYWQPSAWTITEAVHVILLGLIPRHCRDLLGLNFNDLPSDEKEEDLPSKQEVKHARKLLKSHPGKLSSVKIKVLQALSREEGVSVPPPKRGRHTKKEYISALLGAYEAEFPSSGMEDFGLDHLFETLSLGPSSTDDHLPDPPPLKQSTNPVSNPITKQALSEIRDGIRGTIRPNWQAHLPPNFGSPEHGKLKADQWRTAMEFDIPVSLVRFRNTRKSSGKIVEDERLQKLVDFTMDLALAIAWGLSRRTSPKHAERYEFYMKRYLAGIKELFPDYDLKPNHHYALHVPDILRGFGPLHGTWAFKIERLIGSLQKLNTNSKIGEIEKTALSTFCRRANLVRFMDSPRCPAVLKTTWDVIKPSLNLKDLDTGTNTPVPDLPSHSSAQVKLDDDIQAALQSLVLPTLSKPEQAMFNSSTAFEISYYRMSDSITYAGFNKSVANSLIYFRSSGSHGFGHTSTTNLIPAKIQLIFQHYKKAVHPEKDPFIAYPDFHAKLYHKEPLPSVTIVRISDIHCHANCRPWDTSSIVMRAIDRSY